MKNNKLNMLWLPVILSLLLTGCGCSRQEPVETAAAETAVQTTAPDETTQPAAETTAPTEATTEPTEETTEPTEATTAPTTGSSSGSDDDDDDDDSDTTEATEAKLEVPDPGDAKNPYVEVVSDYPGTVSTVSIPSKGTISYLIWGSAGKVITIEDPDAKLTVGDKTYTADENGVLTADLSAVTADAVISLSNSGAEARLFQLSITEPLGTENNPIKLTDIDSFRVKLESGDADGIWYCWTATETGSLTLAAQVPEESTEETGRLTLKTLFEGRDKSKQKMDENMDAAVSALRSAMAAADTEESTTTVSSFDVIVTAGGQTVKLSDSLGGELTAEVTKGKKVIIQVIALADADGNYPGVTAEITGTLAVKPGSSAEYPVTIEDLSIPFAVSLAKDEAFYMTGSFGGRVLTIAEAGEATLTADGAQYKPDDAGTITVAFPKAESETAEPNSLCLRSAAEKTYALVFGYPLGTAENPQRMVSGENRAELAAGNAEGHRFLWKSEAAGELTITLPADTHWQYTLNDESHNSAEAPAVNPIQLTVEAGQEFLFVVNTFDPENPETTPAGTVSFQAAFVDTTPGTQENPAALTLGETKITLEPGDEDGYFFTWTAEKAGSFTITMTEGADWQYRLRNVTAGETGETHTSGAETVVPTQTLTVAAGDVIEILVNTYDPAAPETVPGGEVIFTTAFAE